MRSTPQCRASLTSCSRGSEQDRPRSRLGRSLASLLRAKPVATREDYALDSQEVRTYFPIRPCPRWHFPANGRSCSALRSNPGIRPHGTKTSRPTRFSRMASCSVALLHGQSSAALQVPARGSLDFENRHQGQANPDVRACPEFPERPDGAQSG